jgi:hypothetical protein
MKVRYSKVLEAQRPPYVAKIEDDLVIAAVVEDDDGTSIRISECPDGHGFLIMAQGIDVGVHATDEGCLEVVLLPAAET